MRLHYKIIDSKLCQQNRASLLNLNVHAKFSFNVASDVSCVRYSSYDGSVHVIVNEKFGFLLTIQFLQSMHIDYDLVKHCRSLWYILSC